jgi:hypothetical protein
MTEPQPGRTPDAPDVDEPQGGVHDGAADDTGRTPSAPDVDQPDGGDHAGD